MASRTTRSTRSTDILTLLRKENETLMAKIQLLIQESVLIKESDKSNRIMIQILLNLIKEKDLIIVDLMTKLAATESVTTTITSESTPMTSESTPTTPISVDSIDIDIESDYPYFDSFIDNDYFFDTIY